MGQSQSLPIARGPGRRGFLAAVASLPFYNEFALAQLSYVGGAREGGVMINANENPLGPCKQALEAMDPLLRNGGRYLFGESFRFSETLAAQEGLKAENVAAFAGSSDPLHRTVLAFCGPERPFVTADPGYEAGERAAAFLRAPVHAIPLTKEHCHDVRAMAKAAAGRAGVFYICNPNNPTGTLTPRQDIEWLVENKPAGSILLIDEAYMHFAGIPSCTDLVAKEKDVIVLRTFSKLYGMAGLRAGAAVARPDLLSKIRPYGTGYLPTTGIIGARVSLGVAGLVEERREYVRRIREEQFEWLEKRQVPYIRSVSNKFMMDVGRPGREVAARLAERGVYVGRSWPSMPNHIRVSIGTTEEMKKFQTAYEAVSA